MKYPVSISVVMPCYNSGKYVSAAIESILSQTFPDFELIVIDDGSTDNSHLEIKKHNDSRIKFFRLKENKGNYFARNYGIRRAKGKYICMMDSDDIVHWDRFKVQYHYMNSHMRIGAIASQGELIDEKGVLLNRKISSPCVNWPQIKILFLMNNFILHASLMIRSCLLKKYHLFYNEKYRYSSDFDFACRCADLFPVRNIADTLYLYRVHRTQISSENRVSQSKYADQIRITRLKIFKIRFTKFEENIYLSMMKDARLSSVEELEKGIALFNKILSANLKLEIYNHTLLYDFFNYTLSIAKEKLEQNKEIFTS